MQYVGRNLPWQERIALMCVNVLRKLTIYEVKLQTDGRWIGGGP